MVVSWGRAFLSSVSPSAAGGDGGLLVCHGLGFMTRQNSRNKHQTVKIKFMGRLGENMSLCVLKESDAAF